MGAGGDGAEGEISVSYCGSKAGSHTWAQLQQCSGAHLAGGSCSIPCPKHCQGDLATAAFLLQVQGQRSPHEAKHGFRASHHLPPTVVCSCCAPSMAWQWPFPATGRSSSTSPASSLPVTAKNHSISSPRNIRDDVLQCLLAPLHLSDPEVPPLPTPPPCHSKRPAVPSESFRRDLGNPFDTNSILRYK